MEKTDTLNSLEREITQGKKNGLLGALQIGRALRKIRDGNLFLTDGCDTFPKYCSKVHGFQKSTAYNLCAIYETWGRAILSNPEFQSVDPTRLVKLLPLTTEENKDELLRDAVFIPDSSGFENQIRNRKGEIATDDDHEHDFQPIGIEVCSICGLRRKIKENV